MNEKLSPEVQEEEQVVRSTFYLHTSFIEFIHNAVYTKKISGQVNCTQQDILEEALKLYEQKHPVVIRPQEIRATENKRKKPKKKTN